MITSQEWDPEPSLRRHLRALVGDRSPLGRPEALERAEAYAESLFRGAGLSTFREPIVAAKGAWRNVIADREGAGGNPLFIVGAHLDTVEGTPGADDDASGMAALLSLAEWAGRRPAPSGVTLRFAAFNLEEWGMVGSSEHADSLHASRGRVRGMISLEMIGYVDPSPRSQRYPPGLGFGRRKSGDFISVVGDTASRDLVARVAAAFRAIEGLPLETVTLPSAAALLVGATLSDHSSFWRRGYPAVMVGDTAFYRNPHYHQPTDTLETLSLDFLTRVTRGMALFLENLGA